MFLNVLYIKINAQIRMKKAGQGDSEGKEILW
jgi:hypothetical protein